MADPYKKPLALKMIKAGDASLYPQKTQSVAIHYDAYLLDGNGGYKMWDSSRKRGRPLRFRLGAGQVIVGLDEAVAQLSMGMRARVTKNAPPCTPTPMPTSAHNRRRPALVQKACARRLALARTVAVARRAHHQLREASQRRRRLLVKTARHCGRATAASLGSGGVSSCGGVALERGKLLEQCTHRPSHTLAPMATAAPRSWRCRGGRWHPRRRKQRWRLWRR